MMKIRKKLRSNGGYALVYAVVAMTLMLAVVAGLTLTSVRGLRTQQAAVESLQKRYTAAGKMEEIFAKIAKYNDESITEEDKDEAKKKFQEHFSSEFVKSGDKLEDDSMKKIFTVTISLSGVDAVLLVRYDVAKDAGKYVGKVTSVSYESYSYTEATT